MSVVLQSSYPASPSSIPGVTSAVLSRPIPRVPAQARGAPFKSGGSECFCELTPPRLLPRDPEVMSAVLQSSYLSGAPPSSDQRSQVIAPIAEAVVQGSQWCLFNNKSVNHRQEYTLFQRFIND